MYIDSMVCANDFSKLYAYSITPVIGLGCHEHQRWPLWRKSVFSNIQAIGPGLQQYFSNCGAERNSNSVEKLIFSQFLADQ